MFVVMCLELLKSLIFMNLTRFCFFESRVRRSLNFLKFGTVPNFDFIKFGHRVLQSCGMKKRNFILKKPFLFLLLFVGPVVLAGCSDTLIPPEISLTPASTKSLSAPGELTTASIENEEYRLGIGDKVRILVFGEEDLSGEFTIDNRGSVDLPLIGEAPAAGKTIRQLEHNVVARFKQGYLLDPRVSIDVLNFRPFFIQGEVKTAGEFPYKSGITALDAVAIAGGYSYRAKKNLIYIRRSGSGEERAYDPSIARVMVQPGDNIRVPERFF